MLSTPPAFVLSQDQTLVFNPSTCSLVSKPLTKLLPQTKLKLISIDCRSSFLLFCIVFKVHRALLAQAFSGPAPHERLCILSLIPLPCQHLFYLFFRVSFILFTTVFLSDIHSLLYPNIMLFIILERSELQGGFPRQTTQQILIVHRGVQIVAGRNGQLLKAGQLHGSQEDAQAVGHDVHPGGIEAGNLRPVL